MSSIFGIEAPRAVIYLIAFAIILGLVALFGVVLRKLTGARLVMPGNDRGRSRQPRLGVVDIYDLDRQRQLVLLRRDNVEHLLLIGGLNDIVIETNIVRVAGARLPANATETGVERFEPSFDQAARSPQAEATARPSIETQLAAQLGAFIRRPSDEESDAEQELSPVTSVSAQIPVAPEPVLPEPVLKPDAVTLGNAPTVQGLRGEARPPVFPSVPATPEAPRPEPRPTFTPPPFQARPTPVAPPPPPVQPEPVRAPQPAPVAERQAPSVPPAPQAPDAAILSDMAKQLEEALKRPAAPPHPPAPSAQPEPVRAAPRPYPEEVPEEDELLEPAPRRQEPVAPPAEPFEEELMEEPEPAPQPEPPRPAPPPVQPAPPRAAEAPPTQPASQKAPDPFSVEDIEAEFARLLGRPLDGGKKE